MDEQARVVVITGASSGIGEATAQRLGRQGDAVVLVARREGRLREVARRVEADGGHALVAAADVTEEGALADVARRAVGRFGRVDGWVNNAGVSLFGRVEEAPLRAWRRVIEVNLFGYLHGARAVLPIFRAQGQGVLVNVASIASKLPQPYTSAYVASKHAVRALSMSLRQELALDGADGIHVVTVMPASIDTPLFRHAANYTGRAIRPMTPMYPASDVADVIAQVLVKPRREVLVGSVARLYLAEAAVAPELAEQRIAEAVDREHLARERAPETEGNLFEAVEDEELV